MKGIKTQSAWAFSLPVQAIATDTGLNVQGRKQGLSLNNKGGVAMVSDVRAVRQSILILLATRPGERLMRPDYGCWLQRLVFAPNDAGTAGLAMHYVREALERWEPRVVIEQLEAGADLNATGNIGVLDIVLHYRVQDTGEQDRLALVYDLHEASLLAEGFKAGVAENHSTRTD